MEDLLKLQYSLQHDKVEAALEMSKRGGHLSILMERPALARECRIYIYNLALKLGVRIRGAGLAEGIEIFPKHDELRKEEFGNAICGPLGIHRGANRRFWFYGADYDLEEQIAYLNRLRKVSDEQLRTFIAGKTMLPEFDRTTVWTLSNAFTSAFKGIDPIPQFKATAKLAPFLELATASSN
jgi:hypothetical protein